MPTCAEHAARHHQPRDRERTAECEWLARHRREQAGRGADHRRRRCREAAADGYSIFAMSVPIAAAPAFLAKMPFDVGKDLMPVAKVSTSYNVLVVHPDVAAKSVSELVALLKANPDKLNFSSGGFGTPAHLVGEMFKLETGVKATHVPYQQFPQAIGDLLNGTNQYMFITTLPVTGPDRHRQAAGARRHRAEAPRVDEGRADHRRSRLSQSRRRGLGRLRGQGRHTQGDRRHAEPGDQQGAGEARGSRGPRQGRRRARRRLAGGLWCAAQRRSSRIGARWSRTPGSSCSHECTTHR